MKQHWMLAVTLAACGGGDEPGDDLLSGTVQASYDGDSFDPVFGFATAFEDGQLIGLGDGPIHCGSEQSPDPPRGRTVIASLPTLEVKSYGAVGVQMIRNVDTFEGVGANTGSVTLTSVTDASVAGMISFIFTDSQQKLYTASGTFEVVLCP